MNSETIEDDAAGPTDTTTDRRGRILDAAVAEFAEHGLAGARVDRIAERAGANKQLIYHYFGDKAGLFDAAVRVMAQRYDRVRAELPDDLGGRLVAYFDAARRDHDVVRMLQWEALEHDGGSWVDADARSEHMQRAVARLADDQAAGLVHRDLDTAQLFLTFQALAAHPVAFPQMTRFITGMSSDDPAFVDSRRVFLRRLGDLLAGR